MTRKDIERMKADFGWEVVMEGPNSTTYITPGQGRDNEKH